MTTKITTLVNSLLALEKQEGNLQVKTFDGVKTRAIKLKLAKFVEWDGETRFVPEERLQHSIEQVKAPFDKQEALDAWKGMPPQAKQHWGTQQKFVSHFKQQHANKVAFHQAVIDAEWTLVI